MECVDTSLPVIGQRISYELDQNEEKHVLDFLKMDLMSLMIFMQI